MGPDNLLIPADGDPEDVGGEFTSAFVAAMAALANDDTGVGAGGLRAANGGGPTQPPDTSLAEARERRLQFSRVLVSVFVFAATGQTNALDHFFDLLGLQVLVGLYSFTQGELDLLRNAIVWLVIISSQP